MRKFSWVDVTPETIEEGRVAAEIAAGGSDTIEEGRVAAEIAAGGSDNED